MCILDVFLSKSLKDDESWKWNISKHFLDFCFKSFVFSCPIKTDFTRTSSKHFLVKFRHQQMCFYCHHISDHHRYIGILYTYEDFLITEFNNSVKDAILKMVWWRCLSCRITATVGSLCSRADGGAELSGVLTVICFLTFFWEIVNSRIIILSFWYNVFVYIWVEKNFGLHHM